MLIKNSDQNTPSDRFACDNDCPAPSSNSKGYAYVSQGATGRYCEVLWICDACGDKSDSALDVEAARKKCNANPNGYADF